jgi:hypothetical protein
LDKKINSYIVSSSNLNPKYLDCIEIFLNTWLSICKKFKIVQAEPRIFLISDEIPFHLKKYEKYIILFPQINEIPTDFIAQNIRVLSMPYFENSIVLTTDIDMIPMSPDIYEKYILKSHYENSFIVLRDQLVDEYPICYLVSPSDLAGQIILSTKKQLNNLIQLAWIQLNQKKIHYSSTHGGSGWNFDQKYIYNAVKDFSDQKRIIKLKDSETDFNRIDRIDNPLKVFTQLFSNKMFADYHLHLPVGKNCILIKIILLRNTSDINFYRLFLVLTFVFFLYFEIKISLRKFVKLLIN